MEAEKIYDYDYKSLDKVYLRSKTNMFYSLAYLEKMINIIEENGRI